MGAEELNLCRSLVEVRAAIEAAGFCTTERGDDTFRVDLTARGLDELIVHWNSELTLLNLVLPLPFSINPDRRTQVAVSMAQLNAGLHLRGFTWDPEFPVVLYIVTVVVPPHGLYGPDLLKIMSTCIETVWEALPELAGACLGPHAIAQTDTPDWARLRVLGLLGRASPPLESEWHQRRAVLSVADKVVALIEKDPTQSDRLTAWWLSDARCERGDVAALERALSERGQPTVARHAVGADTPLIEQALEQLGLSLRWELILAQRALVELPEPERPLTLKPAVPDDDAMIGAILEDAHQRGAQTIPPPWAPAGSQWWVAWVGSERVGCVLTWADAPQDVGGIGFISVTPDARGRGLGHALHRSALHALRAQGCSTYIDAVDVKNASMLRVFAASKVELMDCIRDYTDVTY